MGGANHSRSRTGIDEDTTTSAPAGSRPSTRRATAGSLRPSAPTTSSIADWAAFSTACQPASHSPVGVTSPSRASAERTQRPGSDRWTFDTIRSGSRHRHHGSTATTSAPRAAASANSSPRALEAQGAPSRTTTSGASRRRSGPERASASAAPTICGSATRHPEGGSASTGQPSLRARASRSADAGAPSPATKSPRRPTQPVRVPSSAASGTATSPQTATAPGARGGRGAGARAPPPTGPGRPG